MLLAVAPSSTLTRAAGQQRAGSRISIGAAAPCSDAWRAIVKSMSRIRLPLGEGAQVREDICIPLSRSMVATRNYRRSCFGK
jgi:hypothetical protein